MRESSGAYSEALSQFVEFRMRPLILLASLTLVSTPVLAAQHLMKIMEVSTGPASDPDAQYVELRMYVGGQNQVQGHALRVFSATDQILGTFTFQSAVPNGANQASILIATAEASTRYGIAADLAMTPVLPAAGGKLCFDSFDCVSWGNYVGDAVSPSASGNPYEPGNGLPRGQAIRRDISAGNPGNVENSDDTGDSAVDFLASTPMPRNNAGAVGTNPGGNSTPVPTSTPTPPPSAGPTAPPTSDTGGGSSGATSLWLLVGLLLSARRTRRLRQAGPEPIRLP